VATGGTDDLSEGGVNRAAAEANQDAFGAIEHACAVARAIPFRLQCDH
jgi:hypothetical protein